MKAKNSHLKKIINLIQRFIANEIPGITVSICEECGGACCKAGIGAGPLKPKEFKKLLWLLGGDLGGFDVKNKILLFRNNGHCPFLNKKGGCGCYEDRPEVCRLWTCVHCYKDADELFDRFPHVLGLIKKYKPDIYWEIKKLRRKGGGLNRNPKGNSGRSGRNGNKTS